MHLFALLKLLHKLITVSDQTLRQILEIIAHLVIEALGKQVIRRLQLHNAAPIAGLAHIDIDLGHVQIERSKIQHDRHFLLDSLAGHRVLHVLLNDNLSRAVMIAHHIDHDAYTVLDELIERQLLQRQRRSRRFLYRNNRGLIIRSHVTQCSIRNAHHFHSLLHQAVNGTDNLRRQRHAADDRGLRLAHIAHDRNRLARIGVKAVREQVFVVYDLGERRRLNIAGHRRPKLVDCDLRRDNFGQGANAVIAITPLDPAPPCRRIQR